MAAGFVLSVEERLSLERVARSVSEPWRRVRPARALVALADGGSVRGVAREMGAHQDTVRRWRDEFGGSGADGLGAVAPGRGRKRSVPDEVVAAIVADTLCAEPPDAAACWSTRQMAARHGQHHTQRPHKPARHPPAPNRADTKSGKEQSPLFVQNNHTHEQRSATSRHT